MRTCGGPSTAIFTVLQVTDLCTVCYPYGTMDAMVPYGFKDFPSVFLFGCDKMDILSAMEQKSLWLSFLEYRKTSFRLTETEEQQLRAFIEKEKYLPILEKIRRGEPFPRPRRAAISKKSTSKKRIVYVYPQEEAAVMKMMTHLLLRHYDHLFCPNLYSFRAGHGVKEAVHLLSRIRGIGQMWSYKADISNYFNSIPVEKLLPMLETALKDEPVVCRFLSGLLLDPYVYDRGKLIAEEKGIMAGCPLSTFLANLYLNELDALFHKNRWIYARYSDDIIIFAPTRRELDERIALIHQTLAEKGLTINPAKESITSPGEKWVFLGVSFLDGRVDVAPVSVEKIKAKMRRKMRALQRWADRKNADGTSAAKAFIRVFNQKLFENPISNDLTWARWFFPLITTDESLHVIDSYAQQCIRTLATGRHTKAAYNFRYGQMKELGYVSLVNRYYSFHSGKEREES